MIFQYLYNLALGLDQFLNALLLGDPDLSISSRCAYAIYYKETPKWWVRPLAKVIDAFFELFGEENHVFKALELEEDNSKELWRWWT